MDLKNPYKLQANEIARRVNAGEWRSEEIAEKYARRTQNLESSLNTHIGWDYDSAIRDAEKQCDYIEAAKAAKKFLPLAGVPITVKDNIAHKGKPLTCGSRILETYISPYSSTVLGKLQKAGAFLMGRTNMDEFAMGSSNENSAFGPVLNPWNTAYVTGGSSGGAAASVAASMAPLAIGSDTGGSVRQPASFCGVVGLKPTYGCVSRFGLASYASSFDQIGPLAKSCEDAALIFDSLSGHDPMDATSYKGSLASTVDAIAEIKGKNLSGWRIGVLREITKNECSESVSDVFSESVSILQSLGAEIVSVSLPILSYATAAYYLIATAEASSNLSRYDGVRFGRRTNEKGANLRQLYSKSRSEGFGKEVMQRIMLGTFALSSGYYDDYYLQAMKYRQLLTNKMNELFTSLDLLVLPTAPSTAFPIGSKSTDPIAMYESDIYTVPANLTGCPALSLPAGQSFDNLPIGIQLMSARYRESKLLQAGYLLEQAIRWMDKHELRI